MTVVVLVIGVITSLMIASQSQSLLTTRSENTLENVLAMAHRQSPTEYRSIDSRFQGMSASR